MSVLLALTAISTGSLVAAAGTAQAATPLPAHVFAPYFEAWTGESPAALAQQSGAKHLTMAFIQAATKGSCTVYWNGDTGMPIANSTFGADIATQAQLWGMVGITEMIGVDDFGPAETFTTADAATVYNWAVSKGINELSFWALQRDNGSCPGSGASDSCSGIAQDTWFFSHAFEPFTGGTTVPGNDFSLAANPSSAALDPGGSATATVGTAVTSGSAQQVTLAVTGAPAGVTASVSPGSVTAGGSATLSVSTTSAAVPGVYALTVTGTAASASHSATFTLTVKGTPPAGGVVNGGFESGALSPWSAAGDAIVATPAHSGTHALQVVPTSSATGEAAQNVTLAPNHAYTLKAWVQGSYAYVGVRGGANASTWTSSSGWTQLSVPFTTGASGAVTVYVHGWYGQSALYADDVTIG
ncbi:carbohydrate binding domain-containing protein [Amycolatopsis sp. NPDC051061]|uniref:carbohydrate binding domain-containing protein n=1 Tax=Amycolatopsis sp. NPDC051061 TaxID=3155042 RepID=UPI00343A50EE